jgi:hypothetical protein
MIRIITEIGNRTSCKQSYIALKILTLSSLYICSFLCFVVDNMNQYYFVSDIHKRNTRQVLNLNLYPPPTNLSLYQKGSYYMGIKLFNCLPLSLKQLYKDVKQFKLKFKNVWVVTHFILWMSILNILDGKIDCIQVVFLRSNAYILLLPFIYLLASILEL